jgi:UDP-N-acetylglucosamine--N-acetylmuramyl-(pentapeptide) pyrophosphoryl-undecaprenol N-acetylglucosamine transferase
MKHKLKILISGGGTGGHIFPALSIADEIKRRYSDADILFVGADNRMEMERIPAAGYKIIGLPVRGLIRKLTFENVRVILDFFKSKRKARKIIKDFKPDIAIGVGGYASAPVLSAANKMGVPALLQEQNSYAGVTNKLLAKKAKTICVAYGGMERFFPAGKLINTGNPVRQIDVSPSLRKEGRKHFGIESGNPVLFIMGGSLGARTINQALLAHIDKLITEPIEIVWQTGKYYFEDIKKQLANYALENIRILDFVTRMDLAYNVADLVISRAGALSLSELCLVGKPSVLVPSPNVAEDHQTKNAMALVKANAALMVKDIEAKEILISESLRLLKDEKKLNEFGKNALILAKPDATSTIVDEVMKIIDNQKLDG